MTFTVNSNSQGTLTDTLTLPNSARFTSNIPYLTDYSQLDGMNPAAPFTVTFPATSAVTAYLLGGTAGIVAGGFLAARTTRHDRVAGGRARAVCRLWRQLWRRRGGHQGFGEKARQRVIRPRPRARQASTICGLARHPPHGCATIPGHRDEYVYSGHWPRPQ